MLFFPDATLVIHKLAALDSGRVSCGAGQPGAGWGVDAAPKSSAILPSRRKRLRQDSYRSAPPPWSAEAGLQMMVHSRINENAKRSGVSGTD